MFVSWLNLRIILLFKEKVLFYWISQFNRIWAKQSGSCDIIPTQCSTFVVCCCCLKCFIFLLTSMFLPHSCFVFHVFHVVFSCCWKKMLCFLLEGRVKGVLQFPHETFIGNMKTILETCWKALCVLFKIRWKSSRLRDAAFLSDSSDLYDFHLSFVSFLLPMFPSSMHLFPLHPTSVFFFCSYFPSVPEHASFSSCHVLPLTKPHVVLQKKSRLVRETCSQTSFPSCLFFPRHEVLLFLSHAEITLWFIPSKYCQKFIFSF